MKGRTSPSRNGVYHPVEEFMRRGAHTRARLCESGSPDESSDSSAFPHWHTHTQSRTSSSSPRDAQRSATTTVTDRRHRHVEHVPGELGIRRRDRRVPGDRAVRVHDAGRRCVRRRVHGRRARRDDDPRRRRSHVPHSDRRVARLAQRRPRTPWHWTDAASRRARRATLGNERTFRIAARRAG